MILNLWVRAKRTQVNVEETLFQSVPNAVGGVEILQEFFGMSVVCSYHC